MKWLHDFFASLFGGNQPTSPPVAPAPQSTKQHQSNDNGIAAYYAAVEAQKWRGIPEDMRGNLRMDRWGTLYEKNPKGGGWREKGSDDRYDIKPNSSW